MVTGVYATILNPSITENIATPYSNFNENDVWLPHDGDATVQVLENSPYSYFGGGALEIAFNDTNQIDISAPDDKMTVTVPTTGKYILLMPLFKPDETSEIDFVVYVFVNGSLLPENTFSFFLSQDERGFFNNKWMLAFQNLNLEAGQELTFAILATNNEGAGRFLYIDSFSLQKDINNVGYPYIYTEAQPELIEQSNTIDIGSIGGNSAVTITTTVTGVTVGDVIAMAYPSELIDLGLEVNTPIVTAPNTVKFIVRHHGGGSVNLASGTFKFKRL